MIRLIAGVKKIPPQSVMSYDWLNALQDEVCTPIEKDSKLNESTHQLTLAIEKIFSEDSQNTEEITDYSGKPLLLPGLKVISGQTLTFYLVLSVSIRDKVDLEWTPESHQVEVLQNFFEQNPPDLEIDTSSAHFNQLAHILGSYDLLVKKKDGYEPLNLPETPPLTRQDQLAFMRRFYAKKWIQFGHACIPYCFSFSNGAFQNFGEIPPFINLGKLSSAIEFSNELIHDSPKDTWEQGIRALTFLFITSNPPSPVILACDESGQIHSFYNRMVYGEHFSVKIALFKTELQR